MSSHYIAPHRRPLSVDGVRRGGAAPAPDRQPAVSQAAPTAAVRPTPQVQRMSFQPPVAKKERRMLRRLQLPMLISAGLLGGFLIQNTAAGVVLSIGYCLLALVLRLPSRNTFALATLSLSAVCLLLLFKPNGELISNFSTYTFIFLIFGVLSLARESRLPRSAVRSRR